MAAALNEYERQADLLLDALAAAEAVARVKDALYRRAGSVHQAHASGLVGDVLRRNLRVFRRDNQLGRWEASQEHITRWHRVAPHVTELAQRLQSQGVDPWGKSVAQTYAPSEPTEQPTGVSIKTEQAPGLIRVTYAN